MQAHDLVGPQILFSVSWGSGREEPVRHLHNGLYVPRGGSASGTSLQLL